jgi:hypothetical protein
MMPRLIVVSVSAIVTIILLCVVYFIWPTMYIVIAANTGSYRIHRITGVRQDATPRGWRSEDEAQREAQQESLLRGRADRARSALILPQLGRITVDRRQSTAYKAVIYNPTVYKLCNECDANNAIAIYSVVQSDGSVRVIDRVPFGISQIGPCMETVIDTCSTLSLPGRLPSAGRHVSVPMSDRAMSMPAGTRVVQKVAASFDSVGAIRGDNDCSATDRLVPPFTLSYSTSFISTDPLHRAP